MEHTPNQYGQYPQQGYVNYGAPMVQGGFPQQGFQQAPVQVVVVQQQMFPAKKSGYQILNEQTGVFINQKVDWLEVATGCESANRYHVFGCGEKLDKKGPQLFKCKEKSNACVRQCLDNNCRPFNMTIDRLYRGVNDDEYDPFLQIERPFACTWYCCNRPELRVTNIENGQNQYLGKIVDPFTWCNMQLNIYDAQDVLKYKIEGSCAQLGLWCKFPCEPCQTINFEVKSPSGEVLSQLQKQSQGCLKSMYTEADNFALNYPANATDADKALLMAAVLFLDFRHFEQKPGKKNQQAAGEVGLGIGIAKALL